MEGTIFFRQVKVPCTRLEPKVRASSSSRLSAPYLPLLILFKRIIRTPSLKVLTRPLPFSPIPSLCSESFPI